MLEVAVIVGALIGVIYSIGEHGLIRSWKGDKQGPSPAWLRLALALTLMAGLAGEAETWRGFLLVGLVGIGALKMAELLASSVIESIRGY